MNEMVKVKDDLLEEYEKLLLLRDQLMKEAWNLKNLYIHEFGELMTAIFEKKVECISLKKSIALCQEAENHGVCMAEKELGEYISKQVEEYNACLKELLEENERCKKLEYALDADVQKAKVIYRKLAKLLHPDINSETEKVPELAELWDRIYGAYCCNDVKELEELEVLTGLTLEKLGMDGKLPKLPNLGEKIEAVKANIERIRTTEPYLYKLLFDDAEATGEKRRELREELEEYTDYAERLREVMDEFRERGVLV